MIERTWAAGNVVTALAWVVVVLLMWAGWVVALFVSHQIGELLALTAGALAPFAAAIQARCYALKVAALIRAMSPEPRDTLRTLR